MRKIAVLTGTRAEYGLLYWVMRGIQEAPALELQIIVTGMHLSPEFGLTVREIEKDGFAIAERVEILLSSDTEVAISTSMGLGMIGFAKAYERLKPELLVVLGDRFEILSAVAAAVPFRLPVAHIHGGESTEGAMDESFRHAITKMSHIHFPATRPYADRIIQMGESPERVYCFGAPGLDNVYKLSLLGKKELCQTLQLPDNRKMGIVTYHPVTLEKDTAELQIAVLLETLRGFRSIYWVFTLPNADTGGRLIGRIINKFVEKNPDRGKAFVSLGHLNYLSFLKHAVVMVGNSSSGLTEASSFELPVVNIGERQKGRIRAGNVIDVPICEKSEIASAIERAVSEKFRDSLRGLRNPYGDGQASVKIVEVLERVPLDNITKKEFYKLEIARKG